MEASTLRALASDLGYREAWCQAATGSPLPWPAAEDLALTFVAHHLWAPVQREADPDSGMQQDVADGLRALEWLRVDGPHTPKTVVGASPTGRCCTAGRPSGPLQSPSPADRVPA